MNTENRKDDHTFSKGYEEEKEIIISLPESSYHFWDGYFEDIFGNSQPSEDGWTGFTRDYNEFVNAFNDNCVECEINPEEYLQDLNLYKGQAFTYKETVDVLDRLIWIMKEAAETKSCILVKVN